MWKDDILYPGGWRSSCSARCTNPFLVIIQYYTSGAEGRFMTIIRTLVADFVLIVHICEWSIPVLYFGASWLQEDMDGSWPVC